jgi:hypothetical protein
MKHVRVLFLALPLIILGACAGDPVSTVPPAYGASFNETPSSTPPPPAPPAVSAGGNTMGSGT